MADAVPRVNRARGPQENRAMLGYPKRAHERAHHLRELQVVRCNRACPECLLVIALPLLGNQTPVHEGRKGHLLVLHRVMLDTVARSRRGVRKTLGGMVRHSGAPPLRT